MSSLQSLVSVLGGEVVGPDQVLLPGIGHSARDRSVSVRLEPKASGGVLVHCFGAGDPIAEKNRIRKLLSFRSAPEPALRVSPIRPCCASPALRFASKASERGDAHSFFRRPRGARAVAWDH